MHRKKCIDLKNSRCKTCFDGTVCSNLSIPSQPEIYLSSSPPFHRDLLAELSAYLLLERGRVRARSLHGIGFGLLLLQLFDVQVVVFASPGQNPRFDFQLASSHLGSNVFAAL